VFCPERRVLLLVLIEVRMLTADDAANLDFRDVGGRERAQDFGLAALGADFRPVPFPRLRESSHDGPHVVH
jgi:hypothetical protein